MTDTILIVDDSTFIVEGLVALLKRSYQPIPSYGGEECLNILRTVRPSLIILDIMMEPMDGWETLSRIKSNPKTRHIPVLMFSAKKISPEEAEAHRIIIDDFLTKPVNPKKLLEAIEKVLARQGFNRRITDTWNAAGVSPEIIDEYLSLKTNLDVDVSLLAVMRKQLDIAYPDATNREDLLRSIAALEERIRLSRARIDAFCQEKAGVLPVVDREETLPPQPVAEPGQAPAETVTPDLPSEPDQEKPIMPELQTAGADEIPGPAEPEAPQKPVEEIIPGPVVPSPQPEEIPQAEEDSPSMATHSIPAILLPPPGPKPVFHRIPQTVADQSEQDLPVPLPSHDGSASPVNTPTPEDMHKPDGTVKSSLFEPFGKTEQSPPHPRGVQDIVSPEPVRILPVNSSAGRVQAPAPGPGSGTRTPDMRSRAMGNREQKREEEDKRESGQSSSGGNILSRIFATIAGIFRRKKA